MDPITQGLLGAVAVQVGMRQKIGKDATLLAALTAMIPDLDIFVTPVMRMFGADSPLDRLVYHRGFSHSLVMVPVFALLVAVPWWAIRNKIITYRQQSAVPSDLNPPKPPVKFLWLYVCCLIAVATHAPLDWCTSYGTQLLWPFTNYRYSLNCMAIIDPIFTSLLVMILLICWIVRKIHRKKPERANRITIIIGTFGLMLVIGYLGCGAVLRRVAIERGKKALGDTEKIIAADAYPMLGSIVLWRVVLQTPDEWTLMRVHHLAPADRKLRITSIWRGQNTPLIERAVSTREYKIFNWFSGGNLRPEQLTLPDGTTLVDFHDMRYATRADAPQSIFVLRFAFDSDGDILKSAIVGPSMGGRSRKALLADIWKEQLNP
jgi:inner membrane protein